MEELIRENNTVSEICERLTQEVESLLSQLRLVETSEARATQQVNLLSMQAENMS